MDLKKYLILKFIVIFFSFGVLSQEKRLAKADENFDRFAFVDARKIYLDVAKNGYVSQSLFKKLADSYYFNGELKDAVEWYEKLTTQYEDEIEPEYFFRYSQSLKSVQRYDEADAVMIKFNTLSGENDQRAEFFVNTRDYLKFIEMQSGKYRLLKLGVNSKYSEHAPSFDKQGRLVFASSRKSGGASKAVHEWNEMPFLDLYSSGIVQANGILQSPKKLKGKINGKFHESSTTFSDDGVTAYFTRNNYSKRKLKTNANGTTLLKLFKATKEGDSWDIIEDVSFNSDEYSVAHPSLSVDGKKLYFASDMPGSKGQSDLFVVDILEDGTYGTPKNLGARINTEGRETYPYISNSGRLYFSSDGHVGLGGLDIFVCVPDDSPEGFSVPYNVGKPVNGSEDDFSFVLNEKTKIGYFASNRRGGKGSDDIYSFKQLDELITSCNQYLTGTVTDIKTKEVLAETEVILMDGANNELQKTITDEKGKYKFDLVCESSYVIRAVKSEYRPTEKLFETNGVFESSNKLPLMLGKEADDESKEYRRGDDLSLILDLEPIYFDLNKAVIRKESEIELQKIISALKTYPDLKIDVRSHTDSKANDAYNLDLSNRRAQSTIQYIITQGGITADRVTGKGYGETQLINACGNDSSCSDEEHQLNRRSEFIVVK